MGVCQCSDTLVDHQSDTMSSFEEQGVKFKVISPDLYEDVMDFMWTHFFPDEPLSRSLGLTRLPVIDKYFFPDVFRQNCSMAALDTSGNILAVRVGVIKNKNSWTAWMMDKMFEFLPYGLLSRRWPSFEAGPIFIKVQKTIDFNVWKRFDGWNSHSVYEGLAVCSARTHGIRGLGSEVVRRCENLAKEKGCSYTYLLATGNYSWRLFAGLGYTHLNTLTYSEFRDDQGELYLKDTREHIAATTWSKPL